MNTDSKRWRGYAWLRVLVFQWHKSRALPASNFQRPFTRDWEDLLKAANLISAESRDDSFREAKELQASGLVDLKTARYRPYQIERVVIPFAAEPRLRELFAGELPDGPDPRFDFASVKWASQLAFLTSEFVTVAPDDLLKLNKFFQKEPPTQQIVPIKERSLEIFGDEKRLDALVSTSLFRKDRLNWVRDLKCEVIGEPFGWKRGASDTGKILVIENAATWHSYSRWNTQVPQFSAVVYGCGNCFIDSINYLTDILAELSSPQRIFYFGDLDPQGLRIPVQASGKAIQAGLPPIEPHLWSYAHLLEIGRGKEALCDAFEPASQAEFEWLSHLAEPAFAILNAGKRLAQEHIGWEFLNTRRLGD
jgi:hypothetical protein